MSDTEKILFPGRFGFENKSLIDSDFPESARTALWFVLRRTVELNRSEGWYRIAEELLRLHRIKQSYSDDESSDLSYDILQKLAWTKVYIFCERVYDRLLKEEIEYDFNGNPGTILEIEAVRIDFEKDVNQLLAEESIVYRMKDGEFYRPGRYHSQKISSKAYRILQDPKLNEARRHFTKAKLFFEKVPQPDFPNAIKEAVSAMEAATKALFPTKQKDFEKIIKYITDANGEAIPPTIVNGILSPYRFRGAGQGVAHGGTTGGSATAATTEWTITVIAASIIYLRDIAQSHEIEPPPF
ncbi:hypothetical protein HNR65_000495 [Desulfosalsimonas propionicica]|uniref:Uncharacterized protein n=1 Tax=Desulfosalsimonas propionicica TaxID=332175 RepID=A0A7W0HJK5_9BACT|nr:hypothetical protein [Desulfosalsimonas propionicica]MBA2880188.1 hypothetical protein [Desulfosalsimonas propionicica]